MATNRVSFGAFRNAYNPASFPGNGCWESGSIWSLEMIRYRIENLLSVLHRSEEMERRLEVVATTSGRELTDAERQQLSALLMDYLAEMSELDAIRDEDDVGRIGRPYDDLQKPGYLAQDAYRMLRDRREGIEDVLPGRLFMYLAP